MCSIELHYVQWNLLGQKAAKMEELSFAIWNSTSDVMALLARCRNQALMSSHLIALDKCPGVRCIAIGQNHVGLYAMTLLLGAIWRNNVWYIRCPLVYWLELKELFMQEENCIKKIVGWVLF